MKKVGLNLFGYFPITNHIALIQLDEDESGDSDDEEGK